MKKLFKMGIVLTFMLFVLTGCTNTEYNVKVNNDGSGKVEYSVEFDDGELNEKLKENETTMEFLEPLELFSKSIEVAEKNGYNTQKIEKDGYTVGYTANKEYENILEKFKIKESILEDYVTIIDDTGIQKEEGFFITKYTQRIEVDLNKGGEVIHNVNINFDFPMGFSKSNADDTSLGNKLTWNMGKQEMQTIEYTVYSFNISLIIAIIVVILVLVLIIVLIIKKKKNKKVQK